MVVTKYVLQKNIKQESEGRLERLRIALVADLHDRPYADVISEIKKAAPDMIAVAGDLINEERTEHTRGMAYPCMAENALGFLTEAAGIAPTFYVPGNHERFTGRDGYVDIMPIVRTGAVFLDDAALQWNGINIGGLSAAVCHVPVEDMENRREAAHNEYLPDLRWLSEFDRLKGFKILLCHQPEYYTKYIRDTSADIILSGHAHGGQWRIFGRGVFAPDQGWFPKLTAGVHDERLVISRGLANTAGIPRICNPTELVIADVV